MASTPIDKEKKEKKHKKKKLIIYIVVSAILIYLALHFITVKMIEPRLSLTDGWIQEALLHAVTRPFEYQVSLAAFALILCGIGLGFVFVSFREEDKKLRKNEKPAEGRLMNEQDLEEFVEKYSDPIGKKTMDGPNNVIFAKDIFLAIDGFKTRRNCNCLIIGGSGAGKTRFFGAPNILQFNSNLVITDPSGELLRDYGKALENAGYEVLVFNISDVYGSNHYNPFHYIRTEKDIFILVNTLIRNTTPPDAHVGDPIWENGEKLLLESIMLYLWHMAPPEKQNFETVMEMLSMAEIDENASSSDVQSPLDRAFAMLEQADKNNLAVKQYRKFKQGAGKTLKSFLISVQTRLQSFDLEDMVYLTKTDDMHFETFADAKKVLFVVIPTADDTFNFIVSLLYSQLFSVLYEYVEKNARFGWQAKLGRNNIIHVEQALTKEKSEEAHKKADEWAKKAKEAAEPVFNETKDYWEVYAKDGTLLGWRGTKEDAEKYRSALQHVRVEQCRPRCPWHVQFILDEFANIGQIPAFDKKLSTIRKYEMSCAIIVQALSQLKDIYKDQWNTIVGNCDSKLFLGCNDGETIKWLVEQLGKKSVVVASHSIQSGGTSGSSSYSTQVVDVMPYEKITMMQDDECIYLMRGCHAYYGKKYDLEKHPNYKKAEATKGMYEVQIPEEVKKQREMNAKPLSQRIDLATAISAGAEKEAPKEAQKEVIKEETSAPKASTNEEREKEAKKEEESAVEALIELQNAPDAPEMTDQMNEELLEAFHIKEGASDDEIRESTETMIDLENPPDDAVFFSMSA